MSTFLWQDGRRVDRFEFSPAADRTGSGLLLGDGVFETMLASDGLIFARDRHMARMKKSLERVSLSLIDPTLGIEAAIEWLDGRTGQLRVTQTSAGEVLVSAREHVMPQEAIGVLIYPYPKSAESVLAGIKTLSYGENTAALRYARARGFDDVIFINTRGEVIESALANLLLWDGERWWTPKLSSGALPGVTRQLLIEYFSVGERNFMAEELIDMKALALTSSSRDVQPISRFQEHSYSSLGEVDRLRTEFRNWREQNSNP